MAIVNIIPSSWSLFSNNGNQTQFLLPGHTVQKPRMVIFNRVVPSSSGNGPSVPSVRVRILEGELDTAGKPLATKDSVDVTIRNDVSATVAKQVANVMELGRMLSNADFVTALVQNQILPTKSPWDVGA